MTHKEFFNVLIGNPPPEVELEIETKLYRYEKGVRLYKKVRKLGFFGKIKYLLTGNTGKK